MIPVFSIVRLKRRNATSKGSFSLTLMVGIFSHPLSRQHAAIFIGWIRLQ
jgi:hypothetical protein